MTESNEELDKRI